MAHHFFDAATRTSFAFISVLLAARKSYVPQAKMKQRLMKVLELCPGAIHQAYYQNQPNLDKYNISYIDMDASWVTWHSSWLSTSVFASFTSFFPDRVFQVLNILSVKNIKGLFHTHHPKRLKPHERLNLDIPLNLRKKSAGLTSRWSILTYRNPMNDSSS